VQRPRQSLFSCCKGFLYYKDNVRINCRYPDASVASNTQKCGQKRPTFCSYSDYSSARTLNKILPREIVDRDLILQGVQLRLISVQHQASRLALRKGNFALEMVDRWKGGKFFNTTENRIPPVPFHRGGRYPSVCRAPILEG
jgi:hypothetical protein